MGEKVYEVNDVDQMAKVISMLIGDIKENQELIVEIEVKQVGEESK